jgi:hypothetical protein
MQLDKSKTVIVLSCCFLGAVIVAFMLQKNGSPTLEDKPRDQAGQNELYKSITQRQRRETSDNLGAEPNMKPDNFADLESLSGNLIEGDIGDILDMEWSSHEISSDFSDCNKVVEVVKQFPIVSDIVVSEEQLDKLYDCISKMLFYNGNDDYNNYLDFLRKSGETVDMSFYESGCARWLRGGIPEEEIPTDPWEWLSEDLKRLYKAVGCRSMWEGLVLEGSEIKIFKAQTSELPFGRELYELRGGMTTFRHVTTPPTTLDEMLKIKGKVLMADVQVFIAHDDSTGRVVWPYVIRYWFDPIHNSWRVQRAALFNNRHKSYRISILP